MKLKYRIKPKPVTKVRWTGKTLKQFYRSHCNGYLPPDWRKLPTVTFTTSRFTWRY